LSRPRVLLCVFAFVFVWLAVPARATIFGTVRGVVHDEQHRPIPGATVVLTARDSQWKKSMKTNPFGEFEFDAVPLGRYTVAISRKGFAPQKSELTVDSGSAPILHFELAVGSISQTVTVSAAPPVINPRSSTAQTLVSGRQIGKTPGADRTNSMAMITDYVPGAYMVHDQLHVRGGHQVSWEVDGVPVPNTNIATNVGAQFYPKDIDYLEVQRGGYSSAFGDRTYGVFNVEPRTGFEGNRFGEFSSSYGSFHQTDDYLSFGSHTDRFAYYASLNGNRSDYGLETPTAQVLHDATNGYGGFTSLIFNATPDDQLRLVSSLRQDYFQVPNTPGQQGAGIRDAQAEDDAFVNFSWVHTAGAGLVLVVSPFYHFNRSHYIGGPNDVPFSPEDDLGSQYIGGQATLSVTRGRHNAQLGIESFEQRDKTLFGITPTDPPGAALRQREILWGSVSSAFLQDEYRATSWLTFNGGLRYTHYSGSVVENATDPRLGVAIQMPHLHWVLSGFYGRYYQPPPLETVSGPLLDFALQQGFAFLPLRGERDEQWQVSLGIPVRQWAVNLDYFHTWADNFFDHDELGNSNIFLPLTVQTARIQGWEATVRSPMVLNRLQANLAFSNQIAQGRGAVTGGLTDFTPPDTGFFYLDHDQRNTLNTGLHSAFPWKSWASVELHYGSGFLNGDGPAHLPGHSTFDLAVGKNITDTVALRLTAVNVGNTRFLLDNSNTFGGTHWNEPRQFILQLRYNFHF
jgi:outer membrane receptor protein involved in Fe transport